jgi:hypothetical protein
MALPPFTLFHPSVENRKDRNKEQTNELDKARY